ncbi:hypothetical protein B0H14DRAFT_2420782 [Mycena olivaceomarginata]|nr:hypothetical protein B0H14DRAFT_2420782 [Mycena olivaceomarginata]
MDYTAPRGPDRASARGGARPAAPPGRVLFVGNMPYGTEEADLRDKFLPFGPLRSIRLATKPGGEPRGFAHVEYLKEADAVAAYESFAEEPLYMLDRNLRVDYAPVRPTSTNPPTHRLYFYDYRGNEEALRTSLNDFETSIQRVYFLRSQLTGELTGSGFIEFMSVDRATDALKTVGGAVTPYGPLNLEYALVRNPPAGGAGGASFGGRGGGGNTPKLVWAGRGRAGRVRWGTGRVRGRTGRVWGRAGRVRGWPGRWWGPGTGGTAGAIIRCDLLRLALPPPICPYSASGRSTLAIPPTHALHAHPPRLTHNLFA